VFKLLGQVIYIGASLWGFFLSIGLISDAYGFLGIVASLAIAPITLFVFPIYQGFAHDNWSILIIVYGGFILAGLVISFGEMLKR
jgi:hypothetical protein